jgi:hypothetical protein
MRRLAGVIGVGALTIAFGCADDKSGSGSGTDSTGSEDGSGDDGGGTSGEQTGGSGGEDGSSGTPTPTEEPGSMYARGLKLTRVTSNQGVQIEIGRDGAMVPGEDRAGYIIANRNTLIRAFWEVPDEWEPREIKGRLTITRPDGTEEVADETVLVQGDSMDSNRDTTFWWYLPAEMIENGLEYRIELLETDESYQSEPEPDPLPMIPLEGKAVVGVEDSWMEIKATIVPILHQLDSCERAPDVTETDLEDMADGLMAVNPVERAILDVREPFPWTQGFEGGDLVPLLSALSQARGAEQVPPNVFWYGVILPCDNGPDGIAGQAYGIPDPVKGQAYQRVAAGMWYGSGANASGTFIHEVGHSQGRYHVECSGTEAGVDPDYPHEGGIIGVWGFGLHNWEMCPPTVCHDYMTYCNNYWVSDYAWNWHYSRIKILTSWDGEAPPPEPEGELLVGMMQRNGPTIWWTTRGSLSDDDFGGGHRVEYYAGNDFVASVDATSAPIPHGVTLHVAAPLPSDFDSVTSFVHFYGDASEITEVSSIPQLHR